MFAAAGMVMGLSSLTAPPCAHSQIRITLEDALRQARRANASLPVAGIDTLRTAAGLKAARGALWPRLGLDGDLHGGTPPEYASADARLQAVLDVPIYDGGRSRTGVRTARVERALSFASYRMAVADLDLDIRIRYAAILRLEQERELLRQGVERLERYGDLIQARRGSGEPVMADLLKTRVRLDSEKADLLDLERRLANSRLTMNEILGYEPADSLILAPLPAPTPPDTTGLPLPWESSPDLRVAELAERRESMAIDSAKAERRPHLDLSANIGTEPVLGDRDPALLNTGQGSGAEAILSFTWPLWDRGVHRNRLRQARLAARRAKLQTEVARRQVRLSWHRARADLVHIYRQVQTWNHAIPVAEEAYLLAESAYRGGAGSALDVLDAFGQWIQAGQGAVQAVFAYREAEARALRWGKP